jgi:hypothetical protein
VNHDFSDSLLRREVRALEEKVRRLEQRAHEDRAAFQRALAALGLSVAAMERALLQRGVLTPDVIEQARLQVDLRDGVLDGRVSTTSRKGAACPSCGQATDASLPVCPFCGVEQSPAQRKAAAVAKARAQDSCAQCGEVIHDDDVAFTSRGTFHRRCVPPPQE